MPISPELEQKIFQIKRPHSNLFWLYFFRSLAALIMFPFVFVPLLCKYYTLQYQFEDEGVGASWGVFFKRQVFLTYGRIQDIHVNRSLIERWLNLGTVEIQTASGSAGAELSIVGLMEYQQVRDFLYSKMRGARALEPSQKQQQTPVSTQPAPAMPVLASIRDELRSLRTSTTQTYRSTPKVHIQNTHHNRRKSSVR